MKALIFGITGQDAFYLDLLLKAKNIETIGVARNPSKGIAGDVANQVFVDSLIRDIKPEYIFHLAANSTTKHGAIFENHETICTGALNILESVYRYSSGSRVFLSGSALQFENIGETISEKTSFEARSAYSMSRIHSTYTARYFRLLGLKVYVGYFFHHDSPMRSDEHLNMRIVKQALRIQNGESVKIPIGDVEVVKEFNFSGDFMEAVWIFVNQEKYYEVVIGSGKGHRIKEWLEICFGMIGRNWTQFIEVSDYKPEFRSLVSDPRLIRSMGWEPKENIESLARLMMGL